MWQLNGTIASLETSHWSCRLDFAAPAIGLHDLRVKEEQGKPISLPDVSILQMSRFEPDVKLVEAYVRGNDVVATFSPGKRRPCRTQIYWRCDEGPEYFGIELIVSVQTASLEAVPGLTVTTSLPQSAAVVEEGLVLVPMDGWDGYYAEIADESNLEYTTVTGGRIVNKLFPGSLEKGVIRRARILGCFVASAHARQTAHDIRHRYLRSALPLTT